MSKPTAFMRAQQEGYAARRAEKTLAENPYKRSDHGMGQFWDAGWQQADAEIRARGHLGNRPPVNFDRTPPT